MMSEAHHYMCVIFTRQCERDISDSTLTALLYDSMFL
jgi:hypothetical protein